MCSLGAGGSEVCDRQASRLSSAQNRRGFSQTTYRIEVDEGEQALRFCEVTRDDEVEGGIGWTGVHQVTDSIEW